MRALGDTIIIAQDPPEKRAGLIHLPQGAERFGNLGTVLAVGPKVGPGISVGARIIFKRKPSSAISPEAREGDEHYGILVLPEDFILALVEEEGQ